VQTYFSQDNFSTRRNNSPSAGNGFDPESLITGAEVNAGFSYTNSHRAYPDQATYDALVAGDIPASRVAEVAPRVLNQPGDAAFNRQAPTAAEIRAEAEARDPDNWLKRGAGEFARGLGRNIGPSPKLEPDARAMEIADAYEAMQHNPDDPQVKASYDALKRDIRQQWDYATHNLGVKFEPWKQPGQPYNDSLEMMDDVYNHHRLKFFQGGELLPGHPMAEIDPQTGYSYNDMLRAVHDLFGHAMNANQFGAAGEERAWNDHVQMFSPEALGALTSETKGQNSWVNFGPQMRKPNGELRQPGEPGYLPANQRAYAQNKAGLLPEQYHYRLDAPISMVSPNTMPLESMKKATLRQESLIHVHFGRLARELAKAIHLNVGIQSSLGSWDGGAENSYVIHYPVGTDPKLIRWYEANLGILGHQFSTGHFIPDDNGPQQLHTFWVDGATADRDQVAQTLLRHGIENSTILPTEGGLGVSVVGDPEMAANVEAARKELGVQYVGRNQGYAEFPGNSESREAARGEFLATLKAIESDPGAAGWRSIREAFQSRPDYRYLDKLIEETKEPFLEGRHHTRIPGIDIPRVDMEGTNRAVSGVERKYREQYPELHVPRVYYQLAGTEHEPGFKNLPHKLRSWFNYENIYDLLADPDGIWKKINSDRGTHEEKVMRLEKTVKDAGYDGIVNRSPSSGVIEVFKDTPAEEIFASDKAFSRHICLAHHAILIAEGKKGRQTRGVVRTKVLAQPSGCRRKGIGEGCIFGTRGVFAGSAI
jgi:hypothetical protein